MTESVVRGRVSHVFSILLFCVPLMLVGMLALWANVDLAVGRFALFMDEGIVFDGVRQIVAADGAKSFLWAILDGGDQRYGRIMWNYSALASWPAYLIWGDGGLIIAIRLAQVAALLASFVLLSLTLLKNWIVRILLISCLCALPFSEYYATMPKPEPQQLLALAIFIFYYARSRFQLGHPYWIWLGLALGAKISTLPICGVLLAAPYVFQQFFNMPRQLATRLLPTTAYILVGLAIAVPLLLPWAALGIILFVGVLYVARRFHVATALPMQVALAFIIALGIIGISAILFRHGYKTGVAKWLGATVFNTKHGADQTSVNALTWIRYFLADWFGAPVWLTLLWVILGAAVIVLSMVYLRQGNMEKASLQKLLALTIVASGVVLDAAIFAGVHRLWGFYLFPGTVLLLAGAAALAEELLIAQRWARVLPFCFAAISLALILGYGAPHAVAIYRTSAERTASPLYKMQLQDYLSATNMVDALARLERRRLRVAYDPKLFMPQSGPRYEIMPFWGPYTDWTTAPPDLIVLGGSHNGAIHLHTPPDSPEYAASKAEDEGYLRFVASSSTKCNERLCYVPIRNLSGGGKILARQARRG